MKLNHKNILACALCAGLMTLGAAKTQATVLDNELVLTLNVQLTALTTTSKGKVQKIRIGNKDLLNSIDDTTKGDTLGYWLENDDVYVMSKRGVLEEDLTADGFFEIDFSTPFSENDTATHESSTGTVDVSFASDGGGDTIDSDLTFELEGTYSFAETFTHIFKNDRSFATANFNLSNLGNEGFDFDIDESDDVPMSGGITASGSGLVNPL